MIVSGIEKQPVDITRIKTYNCRMLAGWLFMHYLSWLAGPGSLDYLIWLSIWETIKKESEFNLGLS